MILQKTKKPMNSREQVDKNTVFYYIEDHATSYDDQDNEIIDAYMLSFSFYDCHYYVYVTAKNIEKDIPSVQIYGDTKLFDSFESKCEEYMWDFIKKKCEQFDSFFKEAHEHSN